MSLKHPNRREMMAIIAERIENEKKYLASHPENKNTETENEIDIEPDYESEHVSFEIRAAKKGKNHYRMWG